MKQGVQKYVWLPWPSFGDEITVIQTDINWKNKIYLPNSLELLYKIYDSKCFPCLRIKQPPSSCQALKREKKLKKEFKLFLNHHLTDLKVTSQLLTRYTKTNIILRFITAAVLI